MNQTLTISDLSVLSSPKKRRIHPHSLLFFFFLFFSLFFRYSPLSSHLNQTPSVQCVPSYNATVDISNPFVLNTSNLISSITNCGNSYTVYQNQITYYCNQIGNSYSVSVTVNIGGTNYSCSSSVMVNVFQDLHCVNISATLDQSGKATISALELIDPYGYCSTLSFSSNVTSVNCTQLGSLVPVQVTAKSPSGVSSFCTSMVNVTRGYPATLRCLNNTFYLSGSAAHNISGNYILEDQCNSSVSINPSTISSGSLSTNPITVNVTVVDSAGESLSCLSYMTVMIKSFLSSFPGFKSRTTGLTNFSWNTTYASFPGSSTVSLYFPQTNGTYTITNTATYSKGSFAWKGPVYTSVQDNQIVTVYISIDGTVVGSENLIIIQ